MIQNFKFKKPNLWIDFLDLIGYDYNRITFDAGRDKYIISAYGNVTINGWYDCHVLQLPQDIQDEINKEIEKLY
jgi:hypothetical protein